MRDVAIRSHARSMIMKTDSAEDRRVIAYAIVAAGNRIEMDLNQLGGLAADW